VACHILRKCVPILTAVFFFDMMQKLAIELNRVFINLLLLSPQAI
jgi:hypothetical protein